MPITINDCKRCLRTPSLTVQNIIGGDGTYQFQEFNLICSYCDKLIKREVFEWAIDVWNKENPRSDDVHHD